MNTELEIEVNIKLEDKYISLLEESKNFNEDKFFTQTIKRAIRLQKLIEDQLNKGDDLCFKSEKGLTIFKIQK